MQEYGQSWSRRAPVFDKTATDWVDNFQNFMLLQTTDTAGLQIAFETTKISTAKPGIITR